MKKQELTNPHAQAALAFINQDEHHGETGDLPVRYEDVESFAKEAKFTRTRRHTYDDCEISSVDFDAPIISCK